MSLKKIVLQTIDSPRRDFEWRVFMALKFSKEGISSIIGNTNQIKIIHEKSENCLFFGRLAGNTGRTNFDLNTLDTCKKNNTSLFFLHDEGGFHNVGSYQDDVKRIYPKNHFSNPVFKRVYFWGKEQMDVFKHHPEKHKFRLTGSPRFDLCHPSYDYIDQDTVKGLKKKYSDFVLISGRFAVVNMVPDDPSILGKRAYEIRVEGGALENSTKSDVLSSMFKEWEKVSFEFTQFVPMISQLASDFPDLNFVLRPHPAERSSIYKDAFSHYDNIFIDKSFDIRPFIRASKAVIHSECTTGIEAEISAKPNINFRPCLGMEKFKDFSVAGVSDIGILVKNYNQLHDSLNMLIKTDFKFIKCSYDASGYLLNSKDNILSSDIILNEIKDFCRKDVLESKVSSKIALSKLSLSDFKYFMKSILKYLWVRLIFNKYIKSGDSKLFFYSSNDIKKIWGDFGGKPECIKIKHGVVYTYPEVK
jgi:surface carbohydrate biosynthesis protein